MISIIYFIIYKFLPKKNTKNIAQSYKMQKNASNEIFPSYKKISQKLKTVQQSPYKTKLQYMNKRIENIKKSIDFDKEHRQISKKLINNYRKQKMYEKPTSMFRYNCPNENNGNANGGAAEDEFQDLFGELAVVQDRQNRGRIQKYADSLNQYLRNSSDEEENNYQMHLKFRKKALQRQIQAQKSKLQQKRCRSPKQSNEEQQQFYRNMYKNQGMNKKNEHHNPNFNKQNQARCASLAQNKKKLTEMYLPYVQALDFTNIVKWRVLN